MFENTGNFKLRKKHNSTLMAICYMAIEVSGPYAAIKSDATITQNILNNHNGSSEEAPIRWFLNAGDAMILDRGFRV